MLAKRMVRWRLLPTERPVWHTAIERGKWPATKAACLRGSQHAPADNKATCAHVRPCSVPACCQLAALVAATATSCQLFLHSERALAMWHGVCVLSLVDAPGGS